ncbi:MAG: pirin family protein [Actinomycetota bacterium]|nr:pirin family protein [Actinomycetota bacterium]
MTRLDADPTETVAPSPPREHDGNGPRTVLLTSREVPLGGIRAMQVHRTLPQRDLPLVGAWCFLDRFGPQEARMRVEPHPHIGLQTVTWPFIGEVHHRDSIGSDVVVRSGALNLMTSGAGISHSEYSVGEHEVPLDALQLWVALPESRRHGAPAFERHEDLPVVEIDDAAAIVVIGEFAGASSPASVFTPIVGAEVNLPAGARARLPLRPEWEHAIVGIDGEVDAAAAPGSEGIAVGPHHLLYLGSDRDGIEVSSREGATFFLLGGEPFEDDVVMWWNFVARTHEEIVEAREQWEAHSARFGSVAGHGDVRVPAPPLPGVRLTSRRRRL